MASRCFAQHAHQRSPAPIFPPLSQLPPIISSVSSSFVKPLLTGLQKASLRFDVIKSVQRKLLDAVVDSTFRFVDQPRHPSQSNFAPVAEIGDTVTLTRIEGEIPDDFPEGIYIRNGSNPQFGALQSAESMLGRSSEIWVEGEGMLHALYFSRTAEDKKWSIGYKNRYVETETFKLERERGRPSILPAIEGDSPAVLAAYLFNQKIDTADNPADTLSKDIYGAMFEHCLQLIQI